MKAAQLVAYKNYFSEQFGVPKQNIDVEFFIVKRKIVEEIKSHINSSIRIFNRKR